MLKTTGMLSAECPVRKRIASGALLIILVSDGKEATKWIMVDSLRTFEEYPNPSLCAVIRKFQDTDVSSLPKRSLSA